MSMELNTATKTSETPKESGALKGGQVGATPVPLIGIILLTVYLILFSIFLIYSLVIFWPLPSPTEGSAQVSPSVIVTFLFWQFSSISGEIQLLLIVTLAGALGSMVHALRSLYWYVGHRKLMWSWALKYILLPFVGATMGLVFYVIVRSGFFSPQATVNKDISPYGFAALAIMAGLFSEQAVEKLRQVATTLLAEAPKGENHVESTEQQPEAEPKPQEPQGKE